MTILQQPQRPEECPMMDTAGATEDRSRPQEWWSQATDLTEMIEQAIHRGASTVEEIHLCIASLPLEVMEYLGLLERTARDVRRIQEDSIGAVYDRIRRVNREVGRVAAELLEWTGRL
jgi:hypothetical protein